MNVASEANLQMFHSADKCSRCSLKHLLLAVILTRAFCSQLERYVCGLQRINADVFCAPSSPASMQNIESRFLEAVQESATSLFG